MAIRKLNFNSEKFDICYEIFTPKNISQDTKTILILHGWGAEKELMKTAFLEPLQDFKQIYIDLPGFGKSPLSKALHTKDYAKIVLELLDSLNTKIDIVMAHSFGGKVAVLLNTPFLVLLSSAGIALEKSLLIKSKIKIFKLCRLCGLGRFYKFFASNDANGLSRVMYETFKNVVDEDFSGIFKTIKSKTLIFWGQNDKATPLKGGRIISKLIKNNEFFVLQGDHFFFLNHSKFIAQTLISSLYSKNGI